MFSDAFVEPGYERNGEDTTGTNPLRAQNAYCRPDDKDDDSNRECAPAAGSLAVLGDGSVVYFNALEGTEDLEFSIANEVGATFVNDQARLLLDVANPAGRSWSATDPGDARVEPADDPDPLLPAELGNAESSPHNDWALFCADLDFLPDGRLFVVGGTDYYLDPAFGTVAGTTYGVGELAGLKMGRIFNPATGLWSATKEKMEYGRWYPSSVTLADDDKLIFGGVQRLLRSAYEDQLDHPENSGRNVPQVERYNATGETFDTLDASANRSLPLFPRMHLLPNGRVLYNAAGQVFNPFGQAYDEALWNTAAVLDPQTQTWRELGIPGLDPADLTATTTAPGFRGSTFSVMLPLEAPFRSARFLTAGGIIGTTPGTYLATDQSQITTVTIGDDPARTEAMAVAETGRLKRPRWYGTGVLLPDGSVMAFSGANRDEVLAPGTGEPVLVAERFDPATGTWSDMATARHARTYHNTAALLADGSVLVGGHAPIPTMYGFHYSVPGMSPNEGRDPTFEIYRPPYMSADRPDVAGNVRQEAGRGQQITVTSPDAGDIVDALLVRRTSITHLIDGDQRAIVLPLDGRTGDSLRFTVPGDAAVVPSGPYFLFIRSKTGDTYVPAEAVDVLVR